MKTNLDRQAFNHYHPRLKPLYYQVFERGKVAFEHSDIRMCQSFIRLYGLKTKPKGKY